MSGHSTARWASVRQCFQKNLGIPGPDAYLGRLIGGKAYTEPGRNDLSVWDSPDTAEWTHTSIGRSMWIGGASAHANAVLIVGRTSYETRPNNARVWIGTATTK